ncbi:MAG: bifunctional diaminohydroxyphosphoribosylaminopyrimidine deaminase/5-amino-6-(5-phosphoribosylamino)uracil reductase RibD [Ignavibacteriaceae bacterium]|nr:bifunctional diaminohydroxyphosphoribosylaminopyrimidine deaminase/5-amino-6-(5-phosphoribosylamino)uracil reductase RibD [Ignavibacteriaceae bacterium]
MNDEHFLRLALELAGKGAGQVSPNPMVGCVLVKEGKVIGKGYHQKYGGPHAEVMAVNNASESVDGADMYITLEPCDHFGKTPPCTDLIIKSKIRRVVIGTRDPNPLVSGRGVTRLRESGIEVKESVLVNQSREINKFFFKHIRTGYPYIMIKTAASLNGMINRKPGKKAQLTGGGSVKLVHQFRGEYDCILTGSGTMKSDKPEFTVRKAEGRNPAVAILDSTLKTAPQSNVFIPGRKVYIFTSVMDNEKSKPLIEKGAEIITVDTVSDGLLDIYKVMSHLGRSGIISVMVEAGPRVVSSVLQSGLTDEFLLFLAPELITSGENFIHPSFMGIPPGAEIINTGFHKSGSDFYLTYRTDKSLSHVYRTD